ncbi:TRAP transporter substrate-binding protein DctP [Yoonia sp. SS1-5]|uniref:TRAP transporter substrate-binding protein DctP n=1 Tax=Yoonia rhodophyticola TaxID=3137370 RepID=A0AAN0M9M9_9RHOB
MTYPLHRTMTLAMMISSTLGLATAANAQEINLRSEDGTVDITGDFVEFTDNNYVINTPVGYLRVLGGAVECYGDACPDLGAAADSSAITASATANSVVWDVSLWGKRRAFTEHVEKLAELVDEKTDGAFTLNISYGGLSDSRENLDGISTGTFEMAQFCAGYHRHKNPSITVLELPFLGVGSLEQEIKVSQAVYAHPATQADMARWNATLLMPSPLPQYNIVGTGFPPTALEDFGGMTVRATGGIGDALESLGAVLVNMPATEVREGLEANIVDAVSFAPHAHMSFGTIKTGSWWTTNLNPGTVNCPVVVNTNAMAELSEDHRAALLSSVDEALEHYVAYYQGATMDAWLPALRESGVATLTVRENIVDSIEQAVAGPAAAAWVAEHSARGLPAQELYDLVKTTIADGE